MINYSVIIPHYNTPDLLSRCIQSIPDRDDIQVIVVDDNSPGNDNYLTTIPELSRNGVEYYVTKDGLGAGHARNVGLKHAVGKWLIFSDSDDFFVDDFSSFLDEYKNDEHDIIYFNVNSCDCYDITKVYDKVDWLSKYKETRNDIYLRVCYTEPWGKFIKRKLIVENKIEFQETKAHNDLMFSIKAGLQANTILAVDKPIYWYVVREGSLGHQKGEEPFPKICDRIHAWDTAHYYLSHHNIRCNIYLPVFPCVRAMKKNFATYIKLLVFMKKNDYKYFSTILGTLRYYYFRIVYRKVMSLSDVIVEKS